MNLSRPFILRPVGTALVTLGVALAGVLSYFLLPISPLPQVDFPTIAVSASLPGASPETMAATVATPLERSLGVIAGVTEMTSTSSLGSTRVILQFDLSRDIDGAARDVQAAINASRALLPTGMPGNPSYRKVNPADAPIMIVALTSDTLTRGQMYDAASTVLAQRLSQVSGVGQVTVGGGALPAVRVELDPNRLSARGIALDTVRAAIVATNANRPKGAVEDATRYWQIGAADQARTAAGYAPLILSMNGGRAVHLRDVADVVDSVQDVRNDGLAGGKHAVLLILNKAPGANIIATVDAIRALLPQLRASISPAISVDVAMDRTPTIRASIRDVERTLAIAFGLVIVVVFAFLRNARAALLPAVAVPVSIAGTFGAMFLLGYSIDNLSLMAMTVATGFVVDDAIVVLENIIRHIERGLAPLDAALTGAKEIGFTVVSMSVSLVAVFIPILAMGGIIGRLFREFAVVLTVSILVSMLVSLTTTPMMAAALLRPARRGRAPGRTIGGAVGSAVGSANGHSRSGGIRSGTGNLFAAVETGLQRFYRRTLRWTLRHQPIALIALAGIIALNVSLYAAIPKGFFPTQDTGLLIGSVRADQASSFQAMQGKLQAFSKIVLADPAVATATGFTGGSRSNSASMYISLKPRTSREESADQVVNRLRGKLAHLPGANLFLVPVQDIRVGGRQSNAAWQFALQADDLASLREWDPRLRRALMRLPEIVDVNSDQEDHGLQTSLVVDRDAAARLGLTMSTIDSTLNDAFGQRQVGVIYNPLNQYRVVMELASPWLQSPESLRLVKLTTPTGAQVPLSNIARFEAASTPLSVNHQSGSPASTISFNLAPGVSLSRAVDSVAQAMARIGVPSSVHGSFQGSARAFQSSLSSIPLLILAAILTIYLVLGMLYESLVHPLTILSTLPSAGVGALLALMLFHTDFTIIALIAVILLIGIVKKNAIMMIDVALSRQRAASARGQFRARGLGGGSQPGAAIYRAAILRLRPILMTSMAAAFGAVPLALGSGDGAEMRQPLGIAIVGGLIVSQLLTLYTTPVVFAVIDRLRLRVSRWALVGATVAAAGCATVPPEPPALAPVPLQFKEDGVWKPVGGSGTVPESDALANTVPQDWWRLYGDTELDTLQSRLAIGNESIRASVAQVANAQAALQASEAALWPSVGVGANATRGGSPGVAAQPRLTTTSYGLTANASWEADLWGRLSLAARAQGDSLQASRDDLAAARLSAQATLVQTYLAMRSAEAQQALLEDTVTADQRALDLTRIRQADGVVALSDVLQAETQLRTVQAQAREAALQRAQLEHAIAVLLGVAPATLAIAPTGVLPSMPMVPRLLPSTLVRRRPDIAAAERRVAAAFEQVGVANAAYFPSVTLSASTGFKSTAIAQLLSAPSLVWALGPAIAQTLFDGGARDAARAQARAAAEQAASNWREIVLKAFQEVEDNLAALRELDAEQQLQQQALASAKRNLEITQDQYKAGTVGYLNVVSSQTAVLSAQASLLSLRTRQLAATNLLLKNIGGRWQVEPGPAQTTAKP